MQNVEIGMVSGG